jgi:formyltetrahydrofolate deformylase
MPVSGFCPAMRSATLLISCPDRPGLVAAVADFIQTNGGNIVYLDQHVDRQDNVFFMRVVWQLEGFRLSDAELAETFASAIAVPLEMSWNIYYSDKKPRMAIFVSKDSHCLYDLLSRHESGELEVEIPLIVSNHENLRGAAERFGIPFHVFKITKENKAEQETAEHALLVEHGIDTVVLARYMQILSAQMVDWFTHQIINIHHSFLPAFAGARPYHQAYARGVKIVGATSHYVTSDLDEGPIIAQDVNRVSHKESVSDFVRDGKDLEKIVLARAVRAHTQRKVLVYQNRTIVFT